jgi:predicted enzyme related to lactoylglutathione lyase
MGEVMIRAVRAEYTDGMKFTSIVPHFPVPDVVRAADYYVAKLGFTNHGYFLDPPVYAIVERDGVRLHFGKSDTGESAPGNRICRGSFDAYIHVVDLDALFRELQDRGAKILDGPAVRVYGMREVIVEDLNGYKLAFGEEAN